MGKNKVIESAGKDGEARKRKIGKESEQEIREVTYTRQDKKKQEKSTYLDKRAKRIRRRWKEKERRQ